MDRETRFLTPPTIAKMTGVGEDKVYGWIDDGSLKAFNLSGADRPRWKVHPDDFQLFLEGRSNRPKSSRRSRPAPLPKPEREYV